VDEQFARFVEVIQRIHINVPLLDAMQVLTYARYLKDILNNKRPLPTTEVVKLMEHTPQAPGEEERSGVSYDHLLDRGTTIRLGLVQPWSQRQRHAKRRL
jgi:cobalamin biosynthesis Co2+ chelatase CbiK